MNFVARLWILSSLVLHNLFRCEKIILLLDEEKLNHHHHHHHHHSALSVGML